jgi:hypothetical protein
MASASELRRTFGCEGVETQTASARHNPPYGRLNRLLVEQTTPHGAASDVEIDSPSSSFEKQSEKSVAHAALALDV